MKWVLIAAAEVAVASIGDVLLWKLGAWRYLSVGFALAMVEIAVSLSSKATVDSGEGRHGGLLRVVAGAGLAILSYVGLSIPVFYLLTWGGGAGLFPRLLPQIVFLHIPHLLVTVVLVALWSTVAAKRGAQSEVSPLQCLRIGVVLSFSVTVSSGLYYLV